jgi:hypothetical protein
MTHSTSPQEGLGVRLLDNCGGSVCSDRFFGLLSGKIVQLVVVVAVGM